MTRIYDYIIIGGGLAGLQLALKFGTDRFFEQKSVAIIDPLKKNSNDKTWCFWEEGPGEWDHLVAKTWNKGMFITSKKNIDLDLNPYKYKMVRSIDFYQYALSILKELPNFTFLHENVTTIDEASSMVYTSKNSYNSLHIFDSRINGQYLEDKNSSTLFQHFKGWYITTPENSFDPEVFTMMDYRLKYNNTTSFIYVLPLSKNKALIEYTFFTPDMKGKDVYDGKIKEYIREILKIDSYKIDENEEGVIPMTDFPFHKDTKTKITKIGTGGSWVKSSTGYSFKNTGKKVDQIIDNIKKGNNPATNLINKKHRWYDSIFLNVLVERNDLGEDIFTKLYSRNEPREIFKFLDEETSQTADIKIMFSLFHLQFLKAFFKKTF